MDKYVKRAEVLKILKVHYQTLYRMENRNEIEVIRSNGGHRMYNLNKYLRDNSMNKQLKEKICYCRVSSRKQSGDLKRQVEEMKKNILDIG